MLALIMAVVSGSCLALGWLLDQLVLVYVALGVSVLGLALVAIQAWLRMRSSKDGMTAQGTANGNNRDCLTGEGQHDSVEDGETIVFDTAANADAPTEESNSGNADANSSATRTNPDILQESATDEIDTRNIHPASPLRAGSIVYVVPGRKRFHVADCQFIKEMGAQELTLVEARDEAFTPCTACVQAEEKS